MIGSGTVVIPAVLLPTSPFLHSSHPSRVRSSSRYVGWCEPEERKVNETDREEDRSRPFSLVSPPVSYVPSGGHEWGGEGTEPTIRVTEGTRNGRGKGGGGRVTRTVILSLIIFTRCFRYSFHSHLGTALRAPFGGRDEWKEWSEEATRDIMAYGIHFLSHFIPVGSRRQDGNCRKQRILVT